MPLNSTNVDLVIQYALLVAGQEDDYFEKQLGPIHLIKYVYLADLEYARRHNGDTFTGADWVFFKFGPWTQEVTARIEPALLAINPDKRVFESKYEERDEWVRWSLQDDRLLDETERRLPAIVASSLRRCIHTYKADTPSLLDFVYKTRPMLHAAPNEHLDFTLAVEEVSTEKREVKTPMLDGFSEKKRKKLKEGMRRIRALSKSKGERTGKLVKPDRGPRYDEVYEQGITWLDNLAGPDFSDGEATVEFSHEVWKSSARKDKDVS